MLRKVSNSIEIKSGVSFNIPHPPVCHVWYICTVKRVMTESAYTITFI